MKHFKVYLIMVMSAVLIRGIVEIFLVSNSCTVSPIMFEDIVVWGCY